MFGCMTSREGVVLLAAALLVCGPGQARAAAKWVAKGSGQNAYAETASQQPGSRLRFNCEETVTLHFYPPRKWDGTKAFEIVVSIDGERVSWIEGRTG